MAKLRSSKSYLRSAILYSILLAITITVLIYTLVNLRYEQIPFKEQTDTLPKSLIELQQTATQIISVDTTEEAFFPSENVEYLKKFNEKDLSLEAAINEALKNDLVKKNDALSKNLLDARDSMAPHRDQFEYITYLFRQRGFRGYGAIGALDLATNVIEFQTYMLYDQNFYNQVLLLEKQVNEYLLYKNKESLENAYYFIDNLEFMFTESEETNSQLDNYLFLIDGYRDSLEVIVEIDRLIGLTAEEGQLQILLDMGKDLEISLNKAATSLTLAVEDSMNRSLIIIIGALIIIIFIGVTFLLQNRAFLATQIAKKKTEDTLEFISNYDANTGLPNQKRYEEMVNNQLLSMSSNQKNGLMIAIGFKELSDIKKIYGNSGIEKLQIMISKRLNNIGDSSMIGLMDDGEFNVFKEVNHSIFDDIKKSEEIILVLSAPYTLNNELIYLSPTLGIATSPDDANQGIDLIEKASIALKSIPNQLGQEMGLYNTSLSESTKERVDLITSMRQAVENEEFFLVYQPIINLQTNLIMGTEALIRWIKPNGDFISPGVFIPIAEETGLIIPISNWVIKETFKQSASWLSRGINLRISVNLSAVQFTDNSLLPFLADTLKETGADPKMIALELTEYSLLNDEKKTLEILNAMKKMGFTIYLDDFGTGYSSLSYVHKLPIDTLKVDRAFIKDYPKKQETKILAVVYELSRQFGMTVVVEGIENKEQNNLVKELGCEYAQGYLYSKPTNVEEIENIYKMN